MVRSFKIERPLQLPFPFGFTLLIFEQVQDIGMGFDEDIPLDVMDLNHMAQAADNLDDYGFRRIEIA